MSKSIPLGLIDRYRDRLPVADDTPAVTLGEGNTPLIPLQRLGHPCQVYVKFEGLNPTGSFKDRGMTMAVTRAAELGAKAVICASTGNTSAAAAAYAARAGMQAFVLIPEGKIARGKLAQAVMHGAKILQIRGNFDDGMSLVKAVAEQLPVTLVNSVNPYRLQGQKTAAFEIVEALGQAPDVHCLPVGNAGNITAHWIGYSEAGDCGHELSRRTEQARASRDDRPASRDGGVSSHGIGTIHARRPCGAAGYRGHGNSDRQSAELGCSACGSARIRRLVRRTDRRGDSRHPGSARARRRRVLRARVRGIAGRRPA